MTTEEWAVATIEQLSYTSGERTSAHAIIEAAIREAVAEEREACARVAEGCQAAVRSDMWNLAKLAIAADIRARGRARR